VVFGIFDSAALIVQGESDSWWTRYALLEAGSVASSGLAEGMPAGCVAQLRASSSTSQMR